MDTEQLYVYFDGAPEIRLLQAKTAPFVVAFLANRFKAGQQITISHSELLPALAAFQEDVQASWPEALRDRPENYITEWCDRRWLRRTLEAGRNEPVYQLTPQAEEVIEFLDRALHRDISFIGTESRLRMIIELLDQLAIGASRDPSVHLERLRQDRDRIEQQIAQIKREGVVTPFNPTRIREQFAMAVDELRKLQSDFRGVEERFREITRDVQQRQVRRQDSRGGILGQALDSEDALKKEDQGVSFFTFLEFIQSPEQQDRLDAIIQAIIQLQEVTEQRDGLDIVRRMVPALLAEAEKVLQTTRRLSATLRRLLDTRAQQERRRTAEVLQQIQAFAASLSEAPPRDAVQLEVDDKIAITCPFARTDWQPTTEYEAVDLTETTVDEDRRREMFREIARLRPIDWIALRRHIAAVLAHHERPSLRTVLTTWPATIGLVDVVGLLDIAREDGHLVSTEVTEEIVIPPRDDDARTLIVTVPLVTFVERPN